MNIINASWFKWFINSQVITFPPLFPADALLQEDSSLLQQENGDRILL